MKWLAKSVGQKSGINGVPTLEASLGFFGLVRPLLSLLSQ